MSEIILQKEVEKQKTKRSSKKAPKVEKFVVEMPKKIETSTVESPKKEEVKEKKPRKKRMTKEEKLKKLEQEKKDKEAGIVKPKRVNSYIKHVQEYRKQHPGLSHIEAMAKAKDSYKKQA